MGFPNTLEQGGPPDFAPDNKPVQERGGVPYEVWELNQQNERLQAKKGKAKPADPGSQPDVPDNYTELEQQKAAKLGV